MSLILDALKKVDRDRGENRLPALAPVPRTKPAPCWPAAARPWRIQRRSWALRPHHWGLPGRPWPRRIWLVSGVVAVNMAALVIGLWLLITVSSPDTPRDASAPAVRPDPGPAPTVASTPAGDSSSARSTLATDAAGPAPATSAVVPLPATSPVPADRSAAPAGNVSGEAAERPLTVGGPAPPGPAAPPQRHDAPSVEPASVPRAERTVPLDAAPVAPGATRPVQEIAAGAPVPPAAVPAPAARTRTETSASSRADDLALEVVVYADAPEERSAWINGRRYLEGQRLPGGLIVETIRPDAVVLRGQARQTVYLQQP